MISSIFHRFPNQWTTSESDYGVKKIVGGLETLEMFSKTYNYDRETIWDMIKSLCKNQDCKSNLLISSFFRWQANAILEPRL